MSSDKEKLLTNFFKTTTVWTVFFVLLVFLSILFFGVTSGHDAEKLRTEAYIALLCEAIVAAIIYIVAYCFLRYAKELSRASEFQEQVVQPILVTLQGNQANVLTALRDNNQTVHSKIADINWPSLFDGADEVFLLVQGWDGWKTKVADCLPAFLQRGGKIQLILHDPTQTDLLRRMAERKGRTEEEERTEIEATLQGLRDATLAFPNQLTSHYTTRMNWFCGIYFRSANCKHGKLLLSIYQHRPTNEFAVNKVPSFLIRTDVFPELGHWFDEEWKHLLTDALPTANA